MSATVLAGQGPEVVTCVILTGPSLASTTLAA